MQDDRDTDTDKHRKKPRRWGLSRGEWGGLALFAVVGVAAFPFVVDATILNQLWLGLCSAVGISP